MTRLFPRFTQVFQVQDTEKGSKKDAERSKEKAERVPSSERAGVEKINDCGSNYGDCEPESSRNTKEVTSSLTLSHFYKRVDYVSFPFLSREFIIQIGRQCLV